MTVPARQEAPSAGAIESVIARGDLSKLSERQRTDYYVNLCKSLGLNPLTQPFEYLTLNGKLVLYAKRACADQLRKINGISLQVVSQDQSDGLLTVHVRAKDQSGREDEDLGVVNFPDTLRGDARANAILKAVTKAKRRVTLSISGLGFLDETEVEDIPAPAKKSAPNLMIAHSGSQETVVEAHEVTDGGIGGHDPETGEITDWITFGQNMIAAAKRGEDVKKTHAADIVRMEKDAPKIHKRMMTAIAKELKSAAPSPGDDPEAYLKWVKAQCADINSDEGLQQFELLQAASFAKAFPPDVEQAKAVISRRREALRKANA